jgi:hypothetical protein
MNNTNTMVQVNVVNTVTDLKQNADLASLISINPNPANDVFKIETNLTGIKTVELFDINGKLALSNSVKSDSIIDVTLLNEGIYTLVIKTIDNVIYKKIVIFHQ